MLRAGKSNRAQAEELARSYKSQALFYQWNCEAASCTLRIVLANLMVNRRLLGAEDGLAINRQFLRNIGIRPAMALLDISVNNNTVQQIEYAAAYQNRRGHWIIGYGECGTR